MVVEIIGRTSFVDGMDIWFERVRTLLDGTVIPFERADERSESMSIVVCALVVDVVRLLLSLVGLLLGGSDEGSKAVCVEMCVIEVVGGMGSLLDWIAGLPVEWTAF